MERELGAGTSERGVEGDCRSWGRSEKPDTVERRKEESA
jgi:hypothetical protein